MPEDVSLDALLSYPGRSTRALVDLDVLRDNAARLVALLGSDRRLMAVVKADGYGHGAVPVAREALVGGATWLGVATVSEGLELRAAGLDVAILILGPIECSEIASAVEWRLDVTVGDTALVTALVDRGRTGVPLPRLHLKVDTGMHRYGLSPIEALAAFEQLETHAPNRTYAVCTHFASADESESLLTSRQLDVFRQVVARLRSVRPDVLAHSSNSSATARLVPATGEIARVGIALYGCGPDGEHMAQLGIRPVMSVVSRLQRVHELVRGDGVSYGHTYVAMNPERVGLVPIGYADGYPRSLSNAGEMMVDGIPYPVRGRVCMDQTIIGGLPERARSGDWVGVAGPNLGGPTWGTVAEQAGTIDYELLTRVGRRVTRIYHRSGRIVAVRDELGRYDDVDDDNNAPVANRRPGRL